MTVAPNLSNQRQSEYLPPFRRLVLCVLAAAVATETSAAISTAITVLAATSSLQCYGCDWSGLGVVQSLYVEAGTASLVIWLCVRWLTGNRTLALTLALSLAFLLPTCSTVPSTASAYETFFYSLSDHMSTMLCSYTNIRFYDLLLREW